MSDVFPVPPGPRLPAGAGLRVRLRPRAFAALLAALLALAAGAHPARAQEGLGVGIIVGEPTGLSVKKWLGNGRAVDAAAAWSFSENDSLQLHADYLIHDFSLIREGRGRFPVSYGIGGRLKLRERGRHARNDEDAILGVRIPFGVAWEFAEAPVEAFAEIVPILDLAPSTDFDLNGAVGARYYFR